MTSKKTDITLILLLSISIILLTGCQKDDMQIDTDNLVNTHNQDNINTQIDTSNKNNDPVIDLTMNTESQKLIINHGCIGCGRCTLIAPQNFVMEGREAKVSSQENIDSPEVIGAISRCPVSVIEIVEA